MAVNFAILSFFSISMILVHGNVDGWWEADHGEKSSPMLQHGVWGIKRGGFSRNGFSQEALKYTKWYSYRWQIERFHYIPKSGCRVEQLQLHSVVPLRKALIVYAHVAYRSMWLLNTSREHPDIPCSVALQQHEWEALYSNYHQTFDMPEQLPTLQQAVFMIGRLGGFIGRKSDGQPGVKNLWRGMSRLNDIAYTYLALTNGTYKHKTSFG